MRVTGIDKIWSRQIPGDVKQWNAHGGIFQKNLSFEKHRFATWAIKYYCVQMMYL